ncbi:MAG: glycosyltransferase family 39 protein [Candidatus Aminicenantes bacterium]|nr:glycosyltransferase family 39 protein [Candidatus Aminicenantes bacterium]
MIIDKSYSLFTKFSFCLAKHKGWFILFGLFTFVLLSLWSVFILQDFPNSADEYAYLFQARTFLKGKLFTTAHPLFQFFDLTHVPIKNGKMFSIFPPGWPLFLTLAMFLKIPTWAVNPALGTLSLIALFLLGRKMFNSKIAILTVFFVFLSPFFLFNAASYFSHTFCSLLIILVAYFMLKNLSSGKKIYLFLSGLLWGIALITRYYTAVLCLLPLLIYWFVNQKKGHKNLIWFLLGTTPAILFFALYNYQITGNPFLPTFTWVYPEIRPIFFSPIFSLEQAFHFTADHFIRFFLWTPSSFIFIFLFFLFFPLSKLKKIGFLELIPLFLGLGYFFYYCRGGNQYGPRFYYEGFPFLVLFITSQLFKDKFYWQKKRASRIMYWLLLIGLVFNLPLLLYHAHIEHQVIYERKDLFRQVETKNIKNAIIFIRTDTGTLRPMYYRDLLRNNLDFSNDVFYALDLGTIENDKLRQYYPDKDCFTYSFDKSSNMGYLSPQR